jgi:hypothetical protein
MTLEIVFLFLGVMALFEPLVTLATIVAGTVDRLVTRRMLCITLLAVVLSWYLYAVRASAKYNDMKASLEARIEDHKETVSIVRMNYIQLRSECGKY